MARPIKETPILTGKDAENFYQQMKVSQAKRATVEELQSIKDNSKKIKLIAK